MDVKIDPITGDLTLGDQRLGRSLEEQQFLNSALGATAKKVRFSGSRNYYEVWRQISPEIEIGITLGFSPRGPLQRIRAKFVKAGMKDTEWSKALERDIKSYHDEWLQEQLGDPSYEFAWGKIISTVEPHWYSANILIAYA